MKRHSLAYIERRRCLLRKDKKTLHKPLEADLEYYSDTRLGCAIF